jgi:hypothetical protein
MKVVEGHWNGTAFRIMCRQISTGWQETKQVERVQTERKTLRHCFEMPTLVYYLLRPNFSFDISFRTSSQLLHIE